MRTRLHPADALFLAVACCFAAGLFAAWALHGFTWTSSPSGTHKTTAAPVRRPHVVAPRPVPKHRPRTAPHLTLVSTDGASWVSIRAGSVSGRTLYEGLLAPRQRVTLPGRRFVARIQGSANLEALLGKRRLDLAPYEMRDVLITASGIRVLTASPPKPILAS